MLKDLTHADDVLIDKLSQPVADWIFQSFGFDCFRTARMCIDLSALAWILSRTRGAIMAVRSGSPGFMAFQVGLIVIGLGSIMTLRWVFERSGGRRGGAANPLRPSMLAHRLACVLWLTISSFQVMGAPLGIDGFARVMVPGFATIAVYIGACSNRPPVRREFRSGNWRLAEARGR